ncbi:MAG: YfiR family protein [Verrucomicrobiota bacterium]
MRFVAVILKFALEGRGKSVRTAVGVVLSVMFLSGAGRAQEVREVEYEVKAAFLLKFAMFVQWPTNALAADPQVPFVVGILGEDPFGGKFDQAIKTEKVNGRSIEIRRARRAAELLECQVVFICASEAPRFAELIAAFQARPILTVADEAGFALQGGMIGFFKETGKVRFEINPPALERAGLKVSSKLLQVGRRITGRAAAQG